VPNNQVFTFNLGVLTINLRSVNSVCSTWNILRMSKTDKALALLEVSPDVYTKALGLLLQGWTIGSVSRQLGIQLETMKSIQARHPEIAQSNKEYVLGNLNEFVSKGVTRLVNEFDDIPIDKLAFSLGIIIDKAQLLAGQATARVSQTTAMSIDDLMSRLQAMKKAKGKVIDEPSKE